MAHSRVLASFAPATPTALHHRVSEGPQAELRASAVCQRSHQPAATSGTWALASQRGLICLPRHLTSASAAGFSAHSACQPLTVCSAVSLTSTPAPVPVREVSDRAELKPLPRAVENVADDPALHNPLARQNRLSPGWMGVRALTSHYGPGSFCTAAQSCWCYARQTCASAAVLTVFLDNIWQHRKLVIFAPFFDILQH